MPPKNEPTLATALQAAQARMSVSASTNPIGLADHLTRPNQPSNEPRDFDAEIAKQIDALSEGLQTFEETNGEANAELIAAAQAVQEQQLKLDELKRKLAEIQALGTPLDRLNRSVVTAERALTKLIGEYTYE